MAMAAHGASNSTARKIAWALGVLLLMAGAFYLGLRASEWRADRASDLNATNNVVDPLQMGRKAFDSGNYQAAASEFAAVIAREPGNAQAYYWMGRTQMEQRDWAGAAESFTGAISRQPNLFDAYISAAAAYEAAGERNKATRMLNQYAEERRKHAGPVMPSNSNSSAR
jgi:TolA-binding protein